MKSLKFLGMVMAVFMAFSISLSSCLDHNDAESQYISLVTVEHLLGGTVYIPDEAPKTVLLPQNGAANLANAKRAIITYSVPELSNTDNTTQIPITLLAGSEEYPVYEVTNRLDTIADYTSAFTGFSKYSVSMFQFMEVNVVRDRFLNVGFSYIADELGKTCMAPNHVSNDTIYLDFLLKKKGDSRSSGTGMNCYDLSNLRYNSLIDYSKLQPKKDSICVTVTLKATTGIYDDKTTTDSRTVRISY